MLVEQFVKVGQEVEIQVKTLSGEQVFNITLHVVERFKRFLIQDRLFLVEFVLQGRHSSLHDWSFVRFFGLHAHEK